MKDFSEFPGLSGEETLNVLNGTWDMFDIDHDGDIAHIPAEKLPMALAAFSSNITMAILRRYHEWIQSEGNPS